MKLLDAPLAELADLCRIQTCFTDVAGKQQPAREETIRTLLRVWGVEAATRREAIESLKHLKAQREARWLDPVIVAWNGKLVLPKCKGMSVSITPCNGTGVEDGPSPFHSSSFKAIKPLALGYYRLQAEAPGGTCESLVISAPSRAHSPAAMRRWGMFLPMYAAHSNTSWGAGNFSDWRAFVATVAQAGGASVGTLPLMAAFIEKWKCEPSPYSPASRLFWNEFYLDVEQIPELASCSKARKLIDSTAFRRQLEALRSSPLVDYPREMALKHSVLDVLAGHFFRHASERRATFETFIKERPEVALYAAFRATCERQNKSWQQWPESMRSGQLRPGDLSPMAERYHFYAQWLAHEQINAVIADCRSRGMSLHLDLPLGVDGDGYDVWRNRDSFALGANVGAPPDAFFSKGQDWGFPPPHPERIRQNGYGYVIDYLRFQMQHTGLLRLDHVMGLHRLWWVPHGNSAADGAYVRYRPEEFYAILCLESHRHQTELIGENLGTVPPEVNRSMKRHGLRTMYVAQYECQPDANPPLREPPRDCVASLNTHDMPTWAAHWRGLDIADRRALNLLKAGEVSTEAERRARVRRAIEKFLNHRKLLEARATTRKAPLSSSRGADRDEEKTEEQAILAAMCKFLARSRAEWVLVNLEDLWLETLPQNTPGTSTERINWRRKTRYTLEEIFARKEVRELLTLLKDR